MKLKEFETEVKLIRAQKTADPNNYVKKLTIIHRTFDVVEPTRIIKTLELPVIVIVRKNQGIKTFIVPDTLVSNLKSITTGEVKAKGSLDFMTLIHKYQLQERSIPFSIDVKAPVPYPYTRQCAAGIIMAFYNSNKDPLERITDISGALIYPPQCILVTYYLSCITYILGIDLSQILTQEDGFYPFIDDTTLMKLDDRDLYESLLTEREIPVVDICFHALYGAYTFCRAVSSKSDFPNWVSRRYNALRASMQQPTIQNINLRLQEGGNAVNAISAGRMDLKRIVLAIIKKTDLDDTRSKNVRSHIKLLTQLSEMTTYAMINRVIAAGGPILAFGPLVKQLSKYATEKNAVEIRLVEKGYENHEIVYLTMICPGEQNFTANDYPDLIVAAQALEKVRDPKSKSIDNYKAKTEAASIDLQTAMTFYQKQRSSNNLIGTPTDEEVTKLKSLGIDISPLVTEAHKILEILRKQNDF